MLESFFKGIKRAKNLVISSSHKGFTLAEVLIVIGVIGVISALTVPSLIKNYQQWVIVEKLKKVYSELEIAFQPALKDYNGYIPLTSNSTDNEKLILEEIMSNLKYSNYCPLGANTSCNWLRSDPKYLTYSGATQWHFLRSFSTDFSRYILSDGTGIGIYNVWWPDAPRYNLGNKFDMVGWDPGVRGNISIDITGPKGPNKDGIDIFSLGVSNKGLNFYVTNGTACDTSNQADCLKKIVKDGWDIKSNYPWY